MIHFILGGAGSGKSETLIRLLKDAAQAQAQVYAIVPEQFSFTFDGKLYRTLGAKQYNGLESMTFTSLSAMLFRTYGGRSGEYADEMTKTVLLYQTISELAQKKALTYYARQANGQSFPAQVGKVITDLRRAGLTPVQLQERSVQLGERLQRKTADLALMYAAYDTALRERNLKDSLTDVSEAAAIAAGNDHFCGAYIFIDEFESFTGDQMDFLEVLFSQAAEVYITLRTADPDAPDYTVFDTPNGTLKRLQRLAADLGIACDSIMCRETYRFRYDDLAQVSRTVLRPVTEGTGSAAHVHLIEARNSYDEAEYVCAEICRLVREEALHWRDIAIVTHQLGEYRSVLEAAFARCEIPYHIDGSHGVMHTAVMQLMRSVLELISAKKPDSEAVLRYAKTQLLGIHCERIAALEQYCYTWNIDGDTWLSPFPVSEHEQDIEVLRTFLIEPIQALRTRVKHKSGKEICRALYEFLVEMNVPRNTSGVAKAYRDRGDENTADALKQLWGDLIQVLDTLSATLDDSRITISQFSTLCLSLFASVEYAAPPQLLDCVIVSPAETARLNEPKILFVLGVNEGFFPNAVSVSGLFTDRDYLALSDAGLSISRPIEQLLADERLIAYKTLSAASEGLYLCYPLADESGRARTASTLITDLCRVFPQQEIICTNTLSPLFYAATPQAAYHRCAEENGIADSAQSSIRAALQSDPVLGARLSALSMRSDAGAHHISDKALMRRVLGDRLSLSATRVEQYIQCPFSYYATHGLKLSTPQKKELNPLEIGNLVHYCLEHIIRTCETKSDFLALSEQEISAQTATLSAQYRAEELGGDFSKTARFSGNFDRLSAAIPTVVTHLQEELRQSKFEPKQIELVISERDGDQPITLKAPNGVELIFNGKIDRVDVYEENGEQYVRVIDYKTGAKRFNLGHLLYGLDMQMLLYLFTILSKQGRYAGAKPAGVLYMPAGAAECKRDRGAGTIADYLNKNYCMNGVLLRKRSVLTAMEEALAGVYIPAQLAKEDDGGDCPMLKKGSASFLTADAFERVYTHMQTVLTDMAQRLYEGNVAAEPLIAQRRESPCTYCLLGDVCGNADGAVCRVADEEAADAFAKQLTEGGREDGKMDHGTAGGN
ncbi:MAG: PD-(D/E)XK nuclease family protein [Ruminococcus sp.]|nr:PD-(D/E)XK nuclease family protein [Ruminococcus sp.]